MTSTIERPAVQVLLGVGAATLLGFLVPLDRRLLGYALGGTLVLGAVAFAWVHTERFFVLSAFLVFLAQTSFRSRDPMLLLSNVFDAQILFQLGLYALVSVAVIGSLRHGARVHIGILGRNPFAAAYVAFAAISVGWAVSPTVTLARAIQLVTVYGLCWAAMRRIGQVRFLRSIGACIVVYALAGSLLTLLFAWARGPSTPADLARFSWFSVHPGRAGTYAAVGALFILAAILFRRGPAPPFYGNAWRWLLLGYLIVILLKTWARATVFGFVAATVALLMVRLVRGRIALTATVVAVAAGALVGMQAATAAVSGWLVDALGGQSSSWIARFIARGEPLERILSLTGRRALWEYALTLIRERPLLGHGYAGSRAVLLGAPAWAAGESHNAIIEGLVGLGVVGLALLLLAFAIVFASVVGEVTRRRIHEPIHAWLFGVLVFLFVHSFVADSIAGVPGVNLLLFLAAAVAYGSAWPGPEASAGGARHPAWPAAAGGTGNT